MRAASPSLGNSSCRLAGSSDFFRKRGIRKKPWFKLLTIKQRRRLMKLILLSTTSYRDIGKEFGITRNQVDYFARNYAHVSSRSRQQSRSA